MASRDSCLPPNDTGFDDNTSTPSMSTSASNMLTSTLAARQRVDMRWSRVTMDQLEDGQFLQKQLRHLEIAASARHSSRRELLDGRRSASTSQSLLIRDRIASARVKAARGTNGDQESDESKNEEDEVQRVVRSPLDQEGGEQKQRELTNALCIIAELDTVTRGALIHERLTAALRQQCIFPNPVYKLIALRRKIMRHIQTSVTAQHQQRALAVPLWSSTVDAVRQALLPSPNSLENPTDSQAAPSTRSSVGSDVPASACDKNSTMQERSDTLQTLSWILASLRDFKLTNPYQKKEMLHDILQLLSDMSRLVLAPRRAGNLVVDAARPAISDTRTLSEVSIDKELEIAGLVESIQDLLLDIAPKPSVHRIGPVSPKVQVVTSANEDFDIDDKTDAVNALAHLAGATGSIRDVLVLLKVLLGVPDNSRDSPSPPCPCTSSTRVSTSPGVTQKSTDLHVEMYLDSTTRERDDIESEYSTKLHNQSVAAAGALSCRKVRQERIMHSGEFDTTIDGDKLSPSPPRKPGANGHSSKSSILAPVNPVSPTTKAACLDIAMNQQRRSVIVAKNSQQDECGNATLATSSLSVNVTRDINSARRGSSARIVRMPTSRTETPLVTARCPNLNPLDACHIVTQLDEAQPPFVAQMPKTRAPSHSSEGSIYGVYDGDAEDDGDEREVWSCGQNSYGELGHGDTTTRKSFERIEAMQGKEIVLLGAGNEHTIALSEDGRVYTCGYNDNGQCGQGGTARVAHLTEIPKMDECSVTQVHAFNGCEHTIIVMSNGRAATCGYNYRGQLGHGNTTSESVPKLIRSLEGRIVRLVSCSYYHTIITCEDAGGGAEYVMTFGRNDYGQLGHNDSIDRKFPQNVVALSDHHIVSVACGQYHTMVVTSNGKMFGFGKNDYGQLGIDSIESQPLPIQIRGALDDHVALEVRTGYYHTIVLCGGAHLFGFGRNDYGQLGLGKSRSHTSINSQLQYQRFSQPYLLEDLEGKEIVRFACGCYHTVTVSESGMLYVFGRNNHGQLGTGDTNERLYPFPIDDFLGKRVALVAAGFYHTIVLTGGKDVEKQEEEQNTAGDRKGTAADNDGEDISVADPTGMSFTDILASPVMLEFLKCQRSLAAPSQRRGRFCLQLDFEGLSPASEDPELQRDVVLRGEDGQYGGEGDLNDQISASSPETNAGGGDTKPKQRPISAQDLASPANASESVKLVTFILAQLDRLTQTLLPKQVISQTLFPNSTSMVVTALKGRRPVADLGLQFPGGFKTYVVHTHSKTLEHLCSLILHLCHRRIDAIEKLQRAVASPVAHKTREHTSGAPKFAPASNHNLQLYMVLVCIRLLRANLLQLMRSGIAQSVLAFIEASGELSKPFAESTISGGCAKELEMLRGALQQARGVLLSVVDAKYRRNTVFYEGAASGMIGRVTSEAIITLMESFEILIPCRCLQVQFYDHVLRDPANADVTGNCWCRDLCRHGLRVGGVSVLKSKKLFITPLLKRLKDGIILKHMPFLVGASLTCIPPCSLARSDSTTETASLRFITSTYHALLSHLTDSFRRRLRQNPGSDDVKDHQASSTSTSVLQTLQKHLACWALECPSWQRDDQDTEREFKSSQSMQTLIAKVVDSAFRVDESVRDEVPLPWCMMLEFALAAVSACCQTLALISACPPNYFEHQSARSGSSASASATTKTRTTAVELLERSVVGQLLPSLLTVLFEFTNKPLFAASLLPTMKGLLKLLDAFNREFSSLEEMDKSFVEAVASQFSGGSSSSIARGSIIDREVTGGLSRSGVARLKQMSSQTIGQTANVLDALALPWNYRLEKELAVLASEMAVTLLIGEPLVQWTSPKPLEKRLHSLWCFNPLLRGGLSAAFIARSVQASSGSPDSFARRVATHSPFPTPARDLPLSVRGEFLPFSLILPAISANELDPYTQISIGAQTASGKTPLDIRKYRRLFSRMAVRKFLLTIVTCDPTSGDEWTVSGYKLCQSIREKYAKTDPSYRMLLQIASKARKPLPDDDQRDEKIRINDTRLEAAVFIAAAYHNALALQVFHFAVARITNDSELPLPSTLLKLWKFVADFRRLVASKKTSIRSQQHSHSSVAAKSPAVKDARDQILDLQKVLLERCELLLLVEVHDEEMHANTERDAGFVSPANPAFLSTACTEYPVQDTTRRSALMASVILHLQTRYTDARLPFLIAFPWSKWRMIRVLVHTITRWKSCCTRSGNKSSSKTTVSSSETFLSDVSHRVVVFVTSSESGTSPTTIRKYLVDPCRRRSCSARGLEILWELLATVSYDSIQADVVHQVTQALVFRTRNGSPVLAGRRAHLQNVGVFYKDIYNNALSDFFMQLTELIAEKSSANINTQDCNGVSSYWVLAELIASWGIGFDADQFEFVSDIGVLPLIHQLISVLPSAEILEAENFRGCAASTRSNSQLNGLDRASFSSNTPRSTDTPTSRQNRLLYRILWTIFQSLCVNFATPLRDSADSTGQPSSIQLGSRNNLNAVACPVLSETFEVVYSEAQHVSRMAVPCWQTESIVSDTSSTAAISGGIRRSFDLLPTATRFSRFHQRVVIEYQDMLTPPPGKVPMSPLAKANEFSITTWMFIRGNQSTSSAPRDIPEMEPLPEPQLVFLRGDGSELGPYLIILPEDSSNWQIEVGFMLHFDNIDGESSRAKSRLSNVLCERILSKDLVPSNRWIHVAVVVEATKVRLYINGALGSQRAIASQYTAAWSSRHVDLPFHFGRLPVRNMSQIQTASRIGSGFNTLSAVPTLDSALRLLSHSFSSSKTSSFGHTNDPVDLGVGCFDGWLSHFRFHNRSLSPIHVRIVYDELKPSASTYIPPTNRSTPVVNPSQSIPFAASPHARVLDIHTLLIQLSSSPEGIAYFRDQFSRWMHLLWRTFLYSGSFQLQQSSLRVVQSLLPQQEPETVTLTFLSVPNGAGNPGSGTNRVALGFHDTGGGFVQHLLRMVGFGLMNIPFKQATGENLASLPWSLMIADGVHGSTFSPTGVHDEVTKGKLYSDIAQLEGVAKHRNLFVINELVDLLRQLCIGSSGTTATLWRKTIKSTITSILSGEFGEGTSTCSIESTAPDDSHPMQDFVFGNSVVDASTMISAELMGCLYLLTGSTEISLRPGSSAQLKLTCDPVRVIAIESPESPATDSDPRISREMGKIACETCVVVGENYPPVSKPSLQMLNYAGHINVRHDELLPPLSAGLLAFEEFIDGSSPSTVDFKRALFARARHVCPGVCEQLVLAQAWPFRTSVYLPPRRGLQEPPQGTIEQSLQWIQACNTLLKCLAQVVCHEDFALEILHDRELFSMIFSTATEVDGGLTFSSLSSLERKVFQLRQRVYNMLIDLGEEGNKELACYLRAKTAEENEGEEISSDRIPQLPTTMSARSVLSNRERGEIQLLVGNTEREDTRSERGEAAVDVENDEAIGNDSGDEFDVAEDEDEDLDEDSDMDEHRAEIVDELMLMGFPREWCVLALKQTENDLIGASAWIVDSLDFLSKLQISLDKKREEDNRALTFNEDDDDEEQDGGVDVAARVGESNGSLFFRHTPSFIVDNSNLSSFSADPLGVDKSSPTKQEEDRAGTDNHRSDAIDEMNTSDEVLSSNTARERSDDEAAFSPPPFNDKEMGRKIFGEMYFPLEEGGYLSNASTPFQSPWTVEDIEMKNAISPRSSTSASQGKQNRTAGLSFSDSSFEAEMALLDITGLIEMLRAFERQLAVLYCRFLAISVLGYMERAHRIRNDAGINRDQLVSFPQILRLLKFVIKRGDQFDGHNCVLGSDLSSEEIMRRVISFMLALDSDKNVPLVVDYILEQVEAASCSRQFEAYLWTQRELRRSDELVMLEPAVEVAIWLTDCVIAAEKKHAYSFLTRKSSRPLVQTMLRQLRCALGATNLPLKCFVLRTITRLVSNVCRPVCSRDEATSHESDVEELKSLLGSAKLSAQDVMVAAKQRLARETVQERQVYSLYLQAYVELLHALYTMSACQSNSLGAQDSGTLQSNAFNPESTALARDVSSITRGIDEDADRLLLTDLSFDRKRSRTGLLAYSEDGRSVVYSGNEAWKSTCAEQRLSTGQHAWAVRVDKSSTPYIFIGVATRQLNPDAFLGVDDQSWGFIGDKALYYHRSRVRAFGDAFGEGDTIGVHLDCERGTLAFSKNGSPLGVAFDNIVGEVYPAVALYSRHQRVTLVGGINFEAMDASLTSEDDISLLSKSTPPLSALPPLAPDVDSSSGSIDNCLVACEVMSRMLDRRPIRLDLMQTAYQLTTHWLAGSKHYAITRAGWSLWVDVTPDTCNRLGFRAGERVRTSRGNGTVAGVAWGRLWVHVDGETGAWFFHPSKLRKISRVVVENNQISNVLRVTTETASAEDEDENEDAAVEAVLEAVVEAVVDATAEAASEPEDDTSNSPVPADSLSSDPSSHCIEDVSIPLSIDTFASLAQHSRWGGVARDRELLRIVNEHCESTCTSPWNVSPAVLLQLVRDKQRQYPGVLDADGVAGSFVLDDDTSVNSPSALTLIARFALLRYLNLALSRSLPFFDLTWRYFALGDGDSSAVSEPCRLLSACRGSIFLCLKNTFFTSLMQRTANSPSKAEDEYDYPDDLPKLQVNRLKAAAAKCHPGTTKSLFLSLFGQAFEVLHFLPLRTLRMVYSHPMDDGQLRSFKVKFEGEGSDDYGGPYREFFSQFFAELQTLKEHQDTGDGLESTSPKAYEDTEVPTECLLPFLIPSPNWRNGVGSSREKFVLNASLVAPLSSGSTSSTSHAGRQSLLSESPEEKRQLYREMFVFLGQMLGTCLRTGVCVRLDFATSVWKQLVAEDDATREIGSDLADEDTDAALASLKEIDFVAYSLWRSLNAVLDEYERCRASSRPVNHLDEQLSAMDLDFTTTLSDGRTVELQQGGASTSVTLSNLVDYLRLMLNARVHEASDAIALVKRGLNSILPVSPLGMLTWQELETRLCGVDEIDVALLRANTEYDDDVSPKDEFVLRFWRVLEDMNTTDRRAFLRFVWARSRLPLGAAQFHQKFKIQSLVPGGSSDAGGEVGSTPLPSSPAASQSAVGVDSQLPKSHTCFFALQLPHYSSDDICRKQLLYAIHNCVEMDGDFRLADTEMTGWTDVSASDRLRL